MGGPLVDTDNKEWVVFAKHLKAGRACAWYSAILMSLCSAERKHLAAVDRTAFEEASVTSAWKLTAQEWAMLALH